MADKNNKNNKNGDSHATSQGSATASSSSSSSGLATDHNLVYDVIGRAAKGAHIVGMQNYEKEHAASIADPKKWWSQKAREMLVWDKDFIDSGIGGFQTGDIAWFLNGKLNATVQCLDRHLKTRGDQPAIIWECDEAGQSETFTYNQVFRETCKVANVLKSFGVQKGDAVTIYMPMTPQIAFAMLACARIGAPHSVVFAGFSSEALRDRIIDVNSKYILTSDEGLRGGKVIELKKCVDAALADERCSFVKNVFVFQRTGAQVPFQAPRDVWMEPEIAKQRPYCPATSVDAEDTLFYLYTSGSTGKPKGVLHTTAGYILMATMTSKYIFDIREKDIFCCAADCGWITGITYVIYGPLSNGTTTILFESTPLYPDAGRYWDMVQRHKVTQFYTAPTAIRALMRYGVEPINKYDLSSLRILGSVGEPINPEAWKWYFENVGKSQCPIVDTYWQTETGGIIMTPLPGVTPLKPGSCTLPFFGVDPVLLDPQSGQIIPHVKGQETSGVLAIRQPWPSITRTVHNDHERYMKTYMDPYKGYYFTGDGATRDADGYFWITGRVDDVLNVSGHRIGSAEVESALVAHHAVAEAATVGYPHEIKGEGIACFVIVRVGVHETPELIQELKNQVRTIIGAFASPDLIIITPGLPKTRSGKIMRRILRKCASGETDSLGDLTTLADPDVVQQLITKIKASSTSKKAN